MRLLVLVLVFSILSCRTTPELAGQSTPKNIILFVGDGMGPQQISLAYYLAKFGSLDSIEMKNLSFKRIADDGITGLVATEPHGNIVNDSACAATQLATGHWSLPELVGINRFGNSQKTIIEMAKEKGLASGLVSDTRITHATPAAFAAHSSSRKRENEIAENMMKVAPEVMLSGGIRYFIPQGVKKEFADNLEASSRRKDDKDLLAIAKSKGYDLAFNKKQMLSSSSDRLLGLFASSTMPNAIWQNKNRSNESRSIPNLTEMTKVAVDKLRKNEKGFFLMVEAGQIDWAGHSNEPGWLMHEMENANHTLNYLIDYVKKNPDTLLLVTADHETGGFGFTYSVEGVPEPKKFSGEHFKETQLKFAKDYARTELIDRIYQQKKPLWDTLHEFKRLDKKDQTPEKLRAIIEETIGFPFSLESAKRVMKKSKNRFKFHWISSSQVDEKPHLEHSQAFYNNDNAIMVAIIVKELAYDMNVSFSTGMHTATPVMIFALGPQSEQFSGYQNLPDVGQKMIDLLGLR